MTSNEKITKPPTPPPGIELIYWRVSDFQDTHYTIRCLSKVCAVAALYEHLSDDDRDAINTLLQFQVSLLDVLFTQHEKTD